MTESSDVPSGREQRSKKRRIGILCFCGLVLLAVVVFFALCYDTPLRRMAVRSLLLRVDLSEDACWAGDMLINMNAFPDVVRLYHAQDSSPALSNASFAWIGRCCFNRARNPDASQAAAVDFMRKVAGSEDDPPSNRKSAAGYLTMAEGLQGSRDHYFDLVPAEDCDVARFGLSHLSRCSLHRPCLRYRTTAVVLARTFPSFLIHIPECRQEQLRAVLIIHFAKLRARSLLDSTGMHERSCIEAAAACAARGDEFEALVYNLMIWYDVRLPGESDKDYCREHIDDRALFKEIAARRDRLIAADSATAFWLKWRNYADENGFLDDEGTLAFLRTQITVAREDGRPLSERLHSLAYCICRPDRDMMKRLQETWPEFEEYRYLIVE